MSGYNQPGVENQFHPDTSFSRREFLAGSLAMALTAQAASLPGSESRCDMQYRTLGRTGERVSLIGLGGYHIRMQKDENDSIRIIRYKTTHEFDVTYQNPQWLQ